MGTKEPIDFKELLEAGAFTGCHSHSLDGKRRITIPSDWRAEAGDKTFFVLKGVGVPCLYVFTAKDMAKRLEKVRSISVANFEAQQFIRSIFSSADRVELDGTGRIRVSDRLLEYAGVVNQVVLAGAGGRFELWSPELWNKQNSQVDQASFVKAAEFIGF